MSIDSDTRLLLVVPGDGEALVQTVRFRDEASSTRSRR